MTNYKHNTESKYDSVAPTPAPPFLFYCVKKLGEGVKGREPNCKHNTESKKTKMIPFYNHGIKTSL